MTPGRDTWDAFWDGGPRNNDGGGSRSCFAFVFGDCDIVTWYYKSTWKVDAEAG